MMTYGFQCRSVLFCDPDLSLVVLYRFVLDESFLSCCYFCAGCCFLFVYMLHVVLCALSLRFLFGLIFSLSAFFFSYFVLVYTAVPEI